MIANQKYNSILGSNYFEVTNKITLKIADACHKATATYDLVFKRKYEDQCDVEITRLKFLVNQEKVVHKFPMLSNEYFDCLFPLQFKIEYDNLVVSNYKAIKERIAKKDHFLTNKYTGEGIDYIRSQFLKQLEDEKATQRFIASIGILNSLNLTLQRFGKQTPIAFNWNIPSIGSIKWHLDKVEATADTIEYHTDAIDKEVCVALVNTYFLVHRLERSSVEEGETVTGLFSMQIDYESNVLNVLQSTTNTKISVGNNFEYEEYLFIKSLL